MAAKGNTARLRAATEKVEGTLHKDGGNTVTKTAQSAQQLEPQAQLELEPLAGPAGAGGAQAGGPGKPGDVIDAELPSTWTTRNRPTKLATKCAL